MPEHHDAMLGVGWFSDPILSMAHARRGVFSSSLKAKQNQIQTSRILSETTWEETTWEEIAGNVKYNPSLDPTRPWGSRFQLVGGLGSLGGNGFINFPLRGGLSFLINFVAGPK